MNPRRPQRPVELLTWLNASNPLLYTTPPADPPFIPEDQPNPAAGVDSRYSLGFVAGFSDALAAAYLQPFRPAEQPNPIVSDDRRSLGFVAGISDPMRVAYLQPFKPTEQPHQPSPQRHPAYTGFTSDRNLLLLQPAAALPFIQRLDGLDYSRPLRINLGFIGPNLLETTLGTPPPAVSGLLLRRRRMLQ